jgi:hypothetical protein
LFGTTYRRHGHDLRTTREADGRAEVHAYRTLLEQKIRERRQTFEEFAEYAEAFAREHGEPGTLSVRHLQRLAAGRGPGGRPLGPVRPATARLLEHIFGVSIDDLLSPPRPDDLVDQSAIEVRQLLHASRRVTDSVVDLLRDQLNGIRRLDRELGAIVAHQEVKVKTSQVGALLAHCLSEEVRNRLGSLLSEFHCLAGWQALDLGSITESWQQYDKAESAAALSGPSPFGALASAGKAFALVDMNETSTAVDLLATTRQMAERRFSRLLRSWLAAAHGEVLAADGRRGESLRAFDAAATLLPSDTINLDGPYVALDSNHLARWRGHALARCADPNAVGALNSALERLDPTFIRAETGLRVDLAFALAVNGEDSEALAQATHARRLAVQIGSARQQQRINNLAKTVTLP